MTVNLYRDTENGELFTPLALRAEFDDLKRADPDTYDYDFNDYLKSCTDKNGTLEAVKIESVSDCEIIGTCRDILIGALERKAEDAHYDFHFKLCEYYEKLSQEATDNEDLTADFYNYILEKVEEFDEIDRPADIWEWQDFIDDNANDFIESL